MVLVGAVAWVEGVDVTVVLAPVAVGIGLQKLSVVDKRSCSVLVVLRAVGACGVNPERLASQTLEEHREIEALVTEGHTEPVDDLRGGRIADRHHVRVGDHTVTVDIGVLDVTSTVLATESGLRRAVGGILVIDEQTLGDVTPGLPDRPAGVLAVGLRISRLLIDIILAGGVGEVRPRGCPEAAGPGLLVVGLDVDTLRAGLADVAVDGGLETHGVRDVGALHEYVGAVLGEVLGDDVELFE